MLSCKKSSIETHIKTKKHEKGKERLKQKAATEMNIAQALRLFDKEQHPVGETLSESVRVYRVRVLMAMLKSGLALAKIECFRDLFEENALALTSVPSMRQLLPFVLRQETTRIKQAVCGRPISIIFDGTTLVCENLVTVARYLTDDWVIKQEGLPANAFDEVTSG